MQVHDPYHLTKDIINKSLASVLNKYINLFKLKKPGKSLLAFYHFRAG